MSDIQNCKNLAQMSYNKEEGDTESRVLTKRVFVVLEILPEA